MCASCFVFLRRYYSLEKVLRNGSHSLVDKREKNAIDKGNDKEVEITKGLTPKGEGIRLSG